MNMTTTASLTDKLVISASNALHDRNNNGHVYNGMVSCPLGELNILVSPGMIDRALSFMDALIIALRARGHDITIKSSDTCTLIFNQELRIVCRERTKKVMLYDQCERFEFRPTGLLVLKLDSFRSREWMDGRTQALDDQIPTIIAKLELEARRANPIEV